MFNNFICSESKMNISRVNEMQTRIQHFTATNEEWTDTTTTYFRFRRVKHSAK